jgi:hypothetical protein
MPIPAMTEPRIDMWQYMNIIRLAAKQTCMNLLASSIKMVDAVLDKNNTANTQALKTHVRSRGVVYVDDFATLITVCDLR